MITIYDLYVKGDLSFDIGDEVMFYLKKGLERVVNKDYQVVNIQKGRNYNVNQNIKGIITNYIPLPYNNLLIEGKNGDNYFRLKLSQCTALKILFRG